MVGVVGKEHLKWEPSESPHSDVSLLKKTGKQELLETINLLFGGIKEETGLIKSRFSHHKQCLQASQLGKQKSGFFVCLLWSKLSEPSHCQQPASAPGEMSNLGLENYSCNTACSWSEGRQPGCPAKPRASRGAGDQWSSKDWRLVLPPLPTCNPSSIPAEFWELPFTSFPLHTNTLPLIKAHNEPYKVIPSHPYLSSNLKPFVKIRS